MVRELVGKSSFFELCLIILFVVARLLITPFFCLLEDVIYYVAGRLS